MLKLNLQNTTSLYIFQIADWVADSILCKEEARRRAQVIKHLILIADVRHFL